MKTHHNTKTNTPPHTLEGEVNPAIWHSFEQDEHGNLVNVLRTRSGDTSKAALASVEMLKAFSDIHKWLVDEGLDGDMPPEYQDAALAVFDKVST